MISFILANWIWLTMLFVGLVLFFKKRYKSNYIKKAFVRANFHSERVVFSQKLNREVIKKEFNYYKLFNRLYFTKFNESLTEHEIRENDQLIKELFLADVVRVRRVFFNVFMIRLADWTKKIKSPKDKITLAYNGEKLLFAEFFSYLLTGKPRMGKSVFALSLIERYKKSFPKHEVLIITSKKEDWLSSFSYSEEDLFIERLKEIEQERVLLDSQKLKFDRKIIIVCDEAQNINNKTLAEYITKAVREWASQGVITILIAQSAKSSDLGLLPINLVAYKINIKETESKALAQTLFPEPMASQSFYDRVPFGFGYYSGPEFIGKVKLIYD